MAYVITDTCISCGACAAVGPTEDITHGAEHNENTPHTSIDCGACEAEGPTGSIHPGE